MAAGGFRFCFCLGVPELVVGAFFPRAVEEVTRSQQVKMTLHAHLCRAVRAPRLLRVELFLYNAGFVVSLERVLTRALGCEAVGIARYVRAVVELEHATGEFTVHQELAARRQGLHDGRASYFNSRLQRSLCWAVFTIVPGWRSASL